MTNKTPIQELFESLSDNFSFYLPDEQFWLQKEKAFAFDCYEAGIHAANMGIDYENGETNSGAFYGFYSQYATQHSK